MRNRKDGQSKALQKRMLFEFQRATAMIARTFELRFRDLRRPQQLAYLEVLLDEGLVLREVAGRFGVSPRLVGDLSSELRKMMGAQEGLGLARLIEETLWRRPETLGRLKQHLPKHAPAEVEVTVLELVAAGRIEPVSQGPRRLPLYRRVPGESNLVDQDRDLARLDALRHLLANVTRAVKSRFLGRGKAAFARNRTILVQKADLEELEQLWGELRAKTIELEKRCEQSSEGVLVDLSYIWSEVDDV